METLTATAVPQFATGVATVTEQGVNDEQLWVKKAQAADSQAFEALYRLHVGKIYGLCLRMTGNAQHVTGLLVRVPVYRLQNKNMSRTTRQFVYRLLQILHPGAVAN